MMKLHLIPLMAAVTLLAGCNSTKNMGNSEELLSKEQITKALSTAKAPQQYGFVVYPTGNGVAMQGSARLHPRHLASAKFVSNYGPVIKIRGLAARMKAKALIDTAASESWFEFSAAQKFRASFLGLDDRVIEYQGNANIGDIPAYAAVIPQMRIDQLFIENSPVYIRMVRNSLGSLSRNINDAKISSIIGYDILRTFEYIQIDLATARISFSATNPYKPNENLLIGTAGIVPVKGVGLVVDGAVNGTRAPIVLDFAGNYDFAISDANMKATPMVELGDVVYVQSPTIRAATQDGLPRAGMGMLKKYVVTICPRTGVVYFERPAL